MKKINLSSIFKLKDAFADSNVHPTAIPAVYCALGCDSLALALVADQPLCANCVHSRLTTIQQRKIRVTPVLETRTGTFFFGDCEVPA
ncbi:MAG: hypothetical protein JXR76_18890 [Deltaproteobacteria bacterium]|nr:hypothetical protein [Deltaproteobacteria bacterium]